MIRKNKKVIKKMLQSIKIKLRVTQTVRSTPKKTMQTKPKILSLARSMIRRQLKIRKRMPKIK